jgi:hypothetical protein
MLSQWVRMTYRHIQVMTEKFVNKIAIDGLGQPNYFFLIIQ